MGVGQPALTEALVTVRLCDGVTFTRRVQGARGYPANPPTDDQLSQKFLTCAGRVVSSRAANEALTWLRGLESQPRVSGLVDLLSAVTA